MSCGHALVVVWTPRRYVLEVKCFLELTDPWPLFWGWRLCHGEPQTWHLCWVRDFDFMLNLFSLLSPCQLPVTDTASLPATLAVPSEPFTCKQLIKSKSYSHNYTTHIFGLSICSKLKYVECTKYVRVQA